MEVSRARLLAASKKMPDSSTAGTSSDVPSVFACFEEKQSRAEQNVHTSVPPQSSFAVRALWARVLGNDRFGA